MILYILLLSLFVIILYVEYRRINDLTDYTIYWLVLIVFISPLIVYYLDLYNIPTKIGLINENDPNRWFEFTSTYLSTVVGTLVSSLIVILTVLKQIKAQNDSSNEDKRIENAPLMKYYVKNEHEETAKQELLFNSDGNIYNLYFAIENIGLNHAKHIEIELCSKEDDWIRNYMIENEQSILKKDEIYWFDFVINHKKKSQKNKNMSISIKYSDMLNNIYIQKIEINYTISNETKYECKGIKIYFNKIDIKDEVLIK